MLIDKKKPESANLNEASEYNRRLRWRNKTIPLLSLVILLILSFSALNGCGPKNSEQAGGHSATRYASVNINIKRQIKKTAGGTTLVATLPPVKAVRLSVSADDIDNINKVIDIPPGQTAAELEVDVPVGSDRFFEVFLIGFNNKNVLYGNAYADLTTGDFSTVNIFVYQVGGGPPSPVITAPFNGNSVLTGQPSHTFAGTCDPALIDIWVNYFSTNVPSLDTTFSLTSFPNGTYLPGDTTWSYDYDLAPGFNQFNIFGIGADSTYVPPAQQALYFDSSTLLPAPTITAPATTPFVTTGSPITISGTTDPATGIFVVSYLSDYDSSLDSTFELPGYVASDTTWSLTHPLTSGLNSFLFYAYHPSGTLALPATLDVTYTPAGDATAPVITNHNPAPGAVNVPLATSIYFEIDDVGSSVNLNTLNVLVDSAQAATDGIFKLNALTNSLQAISDGVFQNGFSGQLVSDDAGGYNVTIVPPAPFSGNQMISVQVDVSDYASTPNAMPTETYSFTTVDVGDTAPPTVTNLIPADGAINLPVNASVYFEIDDNLSGVDSTTINVTVDSAAAILNGVVQAGFSGSGIVSDGAGGFNVTVFRDTLFLIAQTVPVAITASDLSGNQVNVNYSFTIISYGTQMLAVTKPAPGVYGTFDSTFLITGICSPDTYSIGVDYLSSSSDTSFNLPNYTATDTTWSFLASLELGDNSYRFTGYDSSSVGGAFDTTIIQRAIVGTGYLQMHAPNLGNDFTTPVPTVNFFGDCSSDTVAIIVTHTSASQETTMPVNTFTAYDSSWGHSGITLETGVNYFHFAGYDSSSNVGAFEDIAITLDSTYIAPPVITSPGSGLSVRVAASPVTLAGSCDSTNTVAIFVEKYFLDATLDTTFQITAYAPNSATWTESINLAGSGNYLGVYGVAADSTKSARDVIEIIFDTTVNAPIIVTPYNGVDFSTHQQTWTIDGTCEPDVEAISVNGALIPFTPFSGSWTFDTTLHEGPNSISLLARDDLGNVSPPTSMNIDLKPNPFWALGFDSSVELCWDNLTDPAWDGVLILRKLGDYPGAGPVNGISYNAGSVLGDGDVVYYGSVDSTYNDLGLINQEYYYYQLYPYDIDSNYTYGNPVKRVAAPRSDIKIITNAAFDQQNPRIWGDKVVWEDHRNNSGFDIDVYLYNLSTKTEQNLSNDISWNQAEPAIWGDQVVYSENMDGLYDLYLYDGFYDSTFAIPANSSFSNMTPAIYENNLVYVSNSSAYDYLYKMDLSAPPFVSVEVANDMLGSYNPTLWELSAIYERGTTNQDLFMSDISALSGELAVAASTGIQSSPDLWENSLVWSDNRDGYYDIWYRDLLNTTDTRLQNEPLSQLNPVIFGPLIVWEDYRDATSKAELYMTDLMDTTASEKRLTFTATKNKAKPDIWGEKIVWSQDDGAAAPNWNIYLFDLEPTGEHDLPQPPHNVYGWDIWGDKLVYSDDRNGNPDIFLFDLTTKTEVPVCINSFTQLNPAIYENTVVWEDYREGTADIYYAHKNDFANPVDSGQRVNTVSTGAQEHPDIYGRYVVWQDRRDNPQYDIYYYNLFDSTETLIPGISTTDEYDPRIFRNRVVWVDTRNGDEDIYGFDLAVGGVSYAIVQDTTYNQRKPDVYGNKYIYEEDRLAGKTQIVVFDTTAVDLTFDTTVDHLAPRIFGDRAVWQEDNGVDSDVYLYDLFEGRKLLLTGQKADEINPVINQDKVLYLRRDSASGLGRLHIFDLY